MSLDRDILSLKCSWYIKEKFIGYFDMRIWSLESGLGQWNRFENFCNINSS